MNPTPPTEHRAQDLAMLELLRQVHDTQIILERKVAEVPGGMAKALAVLMTDAFPEGDPDGHRKYHEASIKAAEEKAEFWAKMRYEITKWGLIGFIAWAVGAVWVKFLQGPPA